MPEREKTSVVKIRLSVSEQNSHTLDGQSKICNWLYNSLLEKAHSLRNQYRQTQDAEVGKILYTERGLRNLLPDLKKAKPFLKVVHSSPLKNVALRASSSIQAYQKSRQGKRKGKKAGWPRFRSWNRSWFSLLYDEPSKGFKLEGSELRLSLGVGLDRCERYITVKLESLQALHGKEVRNLRIVKQLGEYFAVFTVRTAVPDTKQIQRAIALDPNHKNLAYGVGTDQCAIEIASPSWLKKVDKRIDELKAKRDRCRKKSKKIDLPPEAQKEFYWRPSRRWEKFNRMLKELYRKRRDQTKTFLFTVSQRLCKQYDLISIGDYTPDGSGCTTAMRRAMNNQSLIGRFKEVLSWVALKSGKSFHEFCEKGTTRTCHCCGHVVGGGILPELRTWTCSHCLTTHIRDENAAQNGLQKTLRDLHLKYLLPGSGRVSIQKRWAWRVWPSGVSLTSRGPYSDSVAPPRNLNESMIAFDQNTAITFT